MIRLLFAFIAVASCSLPAAAEVKPFPASFRTQEIAVDGATLHVRIGGSGPAVVLLHGFGDTGDMWQPLAAQLVKDYTVIVPDLRGMGLSSHPETGYEKKSQAHDIATVLDTARRTYGPVDIYVANAGIAGQSGLGDNEAAWDQIIDINLRAHIRAAKAVVPEWLERASGHFVAVASAAGLLTQLGAAPYSVTKHAAVGFAEWLAIQYGDKGIGVSCVCPMGVDTPLLRGMSDSPDAGVRVAAAAVTSAGAVIGPDTVAALVVQAIADRTFLVLPHPEVLTMYRQKAADYERWIAGMRRFQHTLG